jgi:hypothetical protein
MAGDAVLVENRCHVGAEGDRTLLASLGPVGSQRSGRGDPDDGNHGLRRYVLDSQNLSEVKPRIW